MHTENKNAFVLKIAVAFIPIQREHYAWKDFVGGGWDFFGLVVLFFGAFLEWDLETRF